MDLVIEIDAGDEVVSVSIRYSFRKQSEVYKIAIVSSFKRFLDIVFVAYIYVELLL